MPCIYPTTRVHLPTHTNYLNVWMELAKFDNSTYTESEPSGRIYVVMVKLHKFIIIKNSGVFSNFSGGQVLGLYVTVKNYGSLLQLRTTCTLFGGAVQLNINAILYIIYISLYIYIYKMYKKIKKYIFILITYLFCRNIYLLIFFESSRRRVKHPWNP